MQTDYHLLLEHLARRAYRVRSRTPFHYDLDCKPVTYSALPFVAVGTLLSAALHRLESATPAAPLIVGIGGLSQGADPLAFATMARHPLALHGFSITKQRRGQAQKLVGAVTAGDPVVIVDDVIITGSSVCAAIRLCRAQGLIVRGVIALIDRQDFDGRAVVARALRQIPAAPLPPDDLLVQCLYTRAQVHAAHLTLCPDQGDSIPGG